MSGGVKKHSTEVKAILRLLKVATIEGHEQITSHTTRYSKAKWRGLHQTKMNEVLRNKAGKSKG